MFENCKLIYLFLNYINLENKKSKINITNNSDIYYKNKGCKGWAYILGKK